MTTDRIVVAEDDSLEVEEVEEVEDDRPEEGVPIPDLGGK